MSRNAQTSLDARSTLINDIKCPAKSKRKPHVYNLSLGLVFVLGLFLG